MKDIKSHLDIIMISPNKYDILEASWAIEEYFDDSRYSPEDCRKAKEYFKTFEKKLIAGMKSDNPYRSQTCAAFMIYISNPSSKSIKTLIHLTIDSSYWTQITAYDTLCTIAKNLKDDLIIDQALEKRVAFLKNENKIASTKNDIKKLEELKQKISQERKGGWMNIDDYNDPILEYVSNPKNKIHTIFIYGSSYHGTLTKESDIDIAIHFFEPINEEQWNQYLPQLTEQFQKIFPFELDIQLFNNASQNPAVYEGLKKGCRAFSHSKFIERQFHKLGELEKM